MENRTIMFTHNDLDGVGCGILHKAAFGSHAETYYCGYHNVDEKIQERLKELNGELPTIIISDLGINEETATLVDQYEGEKVLLDHHVTNTWIQEKYDWATIDTEASGTLLVFNHFEKVPREYVDFALHVDDYDRWQHTMPNSKDLNRLLFIVGIERFERRFLIDEKVEFNETEKLLLELETESIDRYVDKIEKGITVYHLSDDKRFGVGFAERYQSETAHELMNRLELEAIALIDVNYRKISFRSKPNFDVGSIVKELGGGGHKNAAGAEFGYKDVKDFSPKYPLYGVLESLRSVIFELYFRFSRTYDAIETAQIERLFKDKNNA
ncbi:DHH family phosphoesterase [Terrihalobacillus insolitus]|uniref:DHH family phosphoesterase n=1 Tax=Terrihalobacillus insolitus TaxID=2950438 RepID=UPI00234024FB|nr:DHHA1 domain-containing protein [Terrihalobacillus insolitus]MDC3413915.1 DHHA1 domain-containing protein [Terrihalobacillus insolitus]